MKLAFNNEKYLELQSKNILERVNKFGEKLYLEFGGKLFDDYHASRVLPGFYPDTKLRMLVSIKEKVEILIVINAMDIVINKVRSDLGITYESDVLRLIDAYRESELYVGSVVITRYENQTSVNQFITKLNNLGIKTYKHYEISSYPYNIPLILSEEGFGKNEYIESIKPIIVVTAPGPGSGKLATCLSQLYHDNKKGKKVGYAKYETFPIWNIGLKNPVNLAYEAATADLNDVNMIDPFHLEAYKELAVNYNRDVEVFPVVKAILEKIYNEPIYNSPTDMGVNMAGFAIVDEEVASQASKDEIVRRYLDSLCDYRNGKITIDACDKIALLMRQLEISVEDRKCVAAARLKAEKANTPSMSIELSNGHILSAKTSELLGASASLILNSLKYLANISEDFLLLSPNVIEPIRKLKVETLGNKNPRLHADEVLIALSISATTNPLAQLALEKLKELEGAQVHSTVILANVDENVFKKLKINLTTEPVFYAKKLYRK